MICKPLRSWSCEIVSHRFNKELNEAIAANRDGLKSHLTHIESTMNKILTDEPLDETDSEKNIKTKSAELSRKWADIKSEVDNRQRLKRRRTA